MEYSPPKTIWEVGKNIAYDEPLKKDDPRYVSTESARGDVNFSKLLKPLGINPKTWELMFEPDRTYSIFCGHRGCGKSTELLQLADKLHDPRGFFVVFLDAVIELDPNSVEYSEILMALAKQLLERLKSESIDLAPVFLANLKNWFDEKIEQNESVKAFAAEIKAGAKAETGIPFLGKLFAGITNSFKTNTTYKDQLRRIIKNSFSQFATAFNQLILAAEEEVRKKTKGRRILFIIDGTDRLSDEDSRRFFIHDVHQLKQIESNFIYCARIHMLFESNEVQQLFNHFILPMIKLNERSDENPIETGYAALRKLIYLRADRSLFDSEKETVDYLIHHCGGNPRELLKLLDYCYQLAEGDVFDRPTAEKAVKELATDYRRILNAEDYKLLHEVDCTDEEVTNNEHTRRLLYNLTLLEYNSYWWQSHPVIRTLPAYKKCANEPKE